MGYKFTSKDLELVKIKGVMKLSITDVNGETFFVNDENESSIDFVSKKNHIKIINLDDEGNKVEKVLEINDKAYADLEIYRKNKYKI